MFDNLDKIVQNVMLVDELCDKHKLSKFELIAYCSSIFRKCKCADDDFCLKSRFCVDCKMNNSMSLGGKNNE